MPVTVIHSPPVTLFLRRGYVYNGRHRHKERGAIWQRQTVVSSVIKPTAG